ncbi:unnamed protein product [Tetraodon nigroviridis]|uniref:Telomeric repeat-binding factor 2-interacting protein 1 n=1 Tax=Tetraodon nigroviridis TaxID=99883 RepID=Q4RX33_TETNG|nr:unnamed protein product [Tetraodon nigroviridis]
MLSKQQDADTSKISPVLFMGVDGKPMSFFLRPSPAKAELQRLIVAGGGVLCSVQQPGAILLMNPVEGAAIPASTTHWYVSTRFIQDCVEKNEQLDLELYRINPASSPAQNTKENSSGGRQPYTAEEDAAILSYVSKYKAETGGNRIWQEMEKERLTSHSWQSMKYRYRVRLAKQQSEVVEKTAAEGESEAETMIDAPSTSAEDMPEEMLVCPQEEKEAVEPPMDEQPVGHPEETVEADSSDGPQQEPPPPEVADPQTAVSPQEEPRPEDSSLVQPDLPLLVKKKPRSSPPSTLPPPRRSARRQGQLHKSPSPEQYSRKLRSSKCEERPPASLLQSKRKKPAAQVDLKEVGGVEELPSKKARGEGDNAKVRPDSASGTELAPQEKRSKPKRQLGILEMAVEEFGLSSDDLVSVTKALLKTSGDFSEARLLLLDSIGSGQHWHCSDDDLLMSGDPVVREQLREKYGEEGIAKRIAFLELQA